MITRVELKVGQQYVEDNGPGKQPTIITVFWVGRDVQYAMGQSSVSYRMVRNRFEGLVRGGVFSLMEKTPEPVSFSPLREEFEKAGERIRLLEAENRDLHLKMAAVHRKLTFLAETLRR